MQKNEFVISRTFSAPPQKVWEAWTDNGKLSQWFGPKGSSITYSKNDFKIGGVFHYKMKDENGIEMWGKWVYKEISAPSKLVVVDSFSDEKGGITRHPFERNWPLEMLSTTTLEEKNGKTLMTVRWKPVNETPLERQAFENGFESMTQGWGGTLDRLEKYLAQKAR